MKKKFEKENENVKTPSWFIWTTTLGLAAAIILLVFNYVAITNLNQGNYMMSKGNSGMNMMNSQMMKMMAGAMMRNGMMTQDEYNQVQNAYDINSKMNGAINGMMQGGLMNQQEAQNASVINDQMRTMMNQ